MTSKPVEKKGTKVRDLFRPPIGCKKEKAKMLYIWAHRGSNKRLYTYNRHCERCKTCRQIRDTYYAECEQRKKKKKQPPSELEGISSFVYFMQKCKSDK